MNKLNYKILYFVNLLLEEEGLENKDKIVRIPYSRIELARDIISKVIDRLKSEKCIEEVDYMQYILKQKEEEDLDIDIDNTYSNFVNNNLLLKPNFKKLKKFKEKNSIVFKINGTPRFDENMSAVIWGDLKYEILKNSNQYFFCKVMFTEQFFTRVKEIDILYAMDFEKEPKRTVYDTMRAVNEKMEEFFKVKQFFECKNKHFWINEKNKKMFE